MTEYTDVLKPLEAATKRLEGFDKGRRFGAIAQIIPVFEYNAILNYYEERVTAYKAVNHNVHDEAPEDYLATSLRAARTKTSGLLLQT